MSSIAVTVGNARRAYNSGITRPIEWRIQQLKRMQALIIENEDRLVQAVHKDFKKPRFETVLTELTVVKNEICHALNNIHSWVQPTHLSKNFAQKFDSVYLQKQPLGVVLNISAWNYPIQLTFVPLVGAIAAGNCVVTKPSEVSSESAEVISELISRYLDQDCFPVITGGIPETTCILEQRFDHILYTGGSYVGKIVMSAAAKFVTPVTLEMGGKSPAYVHSDSSISVAASRITWGKYVNCGQTCTACDYILCHESVVDEFCSEMTKTIKKRYGENPKESPDLARIINERNFKRISHIMDGIPTDKIVTGGENDVSELFIAPTVYRDITMDDMIMQSEIFGPLLPIISVSGPEEAVGFVNSGEKPLALYVFANSHKVIDYVLDNTTSGGSTVNDVLLHAGWTNLPFGGIGMSGIGAYHGKWTFDTFTHERPVHRRKQNMEAMVSGRYPPYTEKNLSMMTWFISEKQGGYCNIL